MSHPLVHNVLFICTGNSARSVLAEALLNAMGQGRFRAFSAGSHPKGEVHPLALKTLADHHLSTAGLSSKSWEVFAAADAPVMQFVFTVCDQAAGEVCPVWPGQPVSAHWGMPDPASVDSDLPSQERAFVATLVTLKRRIELLLALPLDSLERLAIQREVRNIGTR